MLRETKTSYCVTRPLVAAGAVQPTDMDCGVEPDIVREEGGPGTLNPVR